jgi:hypothetical protein
VHIGRIIEGAVLLKVWVVERECEKWIIVKVEGE